MSTKTHAQSDTVAFGFWVYIMSDCVLFAGLFATYAVLQDATFGGPSAADIFNMPFVFTETLLLLTSSFTCGLALLAAYQGRVQMALSMLFVTLALGLSFVGMEVYEFSKLIGEGHGPAASAFLSSFFGLIGTHGTHVFFGSLWMVVLIAHLSLYGLTAGVLRKLLCLSLFWHFLDVVWIFIFTFVYLFSVV